MGLGVILVEFGSKIGWLPILADSKLRFPAIEYSRVLLLLKGSVCRIG